VPSYVIVVVRFGVGGLTMAAVFATGISPMSWNNWTWIVARGVSGGTAVMLFFWSIQHIPLSKAVLYGYTYMIFAAILALPILRERIRLSHWISIAVAMVGIALLLNVERLTVHRADLVALLGAFLSGFAVVCITKCRSTDTSANIFWSQCLFGLVIAAWPAAASWVWPTASQWIQLIAIAVLATIAQLMMTYAYKYTGATYGSLLSQLTPVLTAVIGILYFKEQPTVGFFVGGALVLLSCCYLSVNPVGRAAVRMDSERR
jgi:drug/metabolite transporter (DMT)-like permease